MIRTTSRTTEVWCTAQIEGTHCWPACPFEEVKYLRDEHRHIFHVKAYKIVTHSDRDVEFIMLGHAIKSFFENNYEVSNGVCIFGAMSCEMIANELIDCYGLSKCEVSEDLENGAIITVQEIHNV